MNRKQVEANMEKWARERYEQVHPDLPPEGQFHYHAAIDFLTDGLFDQYHLLFPKWRGFQKIATRVVKRYCSSDTKESQRRQARIENAWKMKQKAGRINGPSIKFKKLKEKSWDQKPPTHKGVGSY